MRILPAALLAVFLPLAASADPRADLAGDWWGTIAERRLSLAADGTLTEFRPSDTEDHKGTWEIKDDQISLLYEGRKRADTFTFAIEKDELTLTDADGRATRLKKEARADREKRLTDLLVGGMKKSRESDEEPDQFRRERLIAESREMAGQVEPLVRSLAGSDHEKQHAYVDGLVKAREPGLVEGPHEGAAEPAEVKARAAEPAGAKRKCMNGLKQVGVYLSLYESRFKQYPKSLNQLKSPGLVTDPSILECPADAPGAGKQFGYVYPAKGDETPPDAVMAFDTVPHQDGTRNVLFFQGRVVSLKEAEFRKALAASGGSLNSAAPRSKGVKAGAETKDGKLVVTVRARVVDLKHETIEGKEHVKARVRVSAVVDGATVESGVRVVEGAPAADGSDVEVAVTLPTSDPDKIESVTLLIEDRVAFETGETRIEGKHISRAK